MQTVDVLQTMFSRAPWNAVTRQTLGISEQQQIGLTEKPGMHGWSLIDFVRLDKNIQRQHGM